MKVTQNTKSGKRKLEPPTGLATEAADSPAAKKARRRKAEATKPCTPNKNNGSVSFDGSVASGKSRDNTRSTVARMRRMENTGVVHFVSNKIRLNNKTKLLDGNAPTMLVVP